MNILPTLEGGLRVDCESPLDWQLLHGITLDALTRDEPLANHLGKLITDEDVAVDWQDFVVPGLAEEFSAALLHVATAVEFARLESEGRPGTLWITREEASHWFSALNQARLAIEERNHFGPSETIDLANLPPEHRSAFLRSQFYCAIQSLLLEHVMR
jgi:hypothetical protein